MRFFELGRVHDPFEHNNTHRSRHQNQHQHNVIEILSNHIEGLVRSIPNEEKVGTVT